MSMTDADDLAVLMPEQELVIAGNNLTVHEYTLEEQLQHRQVLRPVIDAIAGLLAGMDNDSVALEALTDALATVYEPVISAVALSCGQPREWVAGLTGDDAEVLLFTWWSVNAGFFTRQATMPQMQALARSLRAGATSSQP